MKAHFSTTALLLCLSCSSLAAPNFPQLSGRVVDSAGMLGSSSVRSITRLLAEHERTTTNQIVVATLSDLQGYSIEEYGYQLGRHWAIGQKDSNNGVLLLVAQKERKVRIEVGYGLEGTLTDALSGNIIQTVIKPKFKKGNFSQGVSLGVAAITDAIAGQYQAKKVKKSSSRYWAIFVLALIFFQFIRSFFYSSSSGNNNGRDSHFGGFGSGSSGGFSGGFSGGGGSFGGGGASGGW